MKSPSEALRLDSTRGGAVFHTRNSNQVYSLCLLFPVSTDSLIKPACLFLPIIPNAAIFTAGSYLASF